MELEQSVRVRVGMRMYMNSFLYVCVCTCLDDGRFGFVRAATGGFWPSADEIWLFLARWLQFLVVL